MNKDYKIGRNEQQSVVCYKITETSTFTLEKLKIKDIKDVTSISKQNTN